jgi:peptidoglycan/LPS O-acetylase OafA/YrhL
MRRVPELDSLRGLASLLVVLYHSGFAFPGGGFAVDLFFVLSGYLITQIIIKNGERGGFLTTFYVRRGLRIWPIYYLTILVLVLVWPLLQRPCVMDALPYYLTYTQYTPIYFGRRPPDITLPLYHTWTLAIEEQFYLIWPAAVLLVGARRIIPLAALGLLATFAARYGRLSVWTLLGRLDGLMLGAVLAAVLSDASRFRGRPWRLAPALAACVVLGPPLVWATIRAERNWPGLGGDVQIVLSYFFINVTFFGLVGLTALCAGRPLLAPLRNRWLCYLGMISYGLYLYHIPVRHAAELIGGRLGAGDDSQTVRAVGILISLAVAVFSWEYFERPILSLKERFRYRSTPVPAGERLAGVGPVGWSPAGEDVAG